MKNIIKSLMLGVLVMISTTGCVGPSTVDAGEEAVLIYKPWFFGHGGVDPEPVDTGLTWTVWSTEVQRVNLKPFNIDEVFDDLVTSDNNTVDFKIHLTFQHIKGKSPVLVEKFGKTVRESYDDGTVRAKFGWYGNKVREPLRNSVRSFTKGHKMFDMTTNKEVSDKLEKQVQEEIRNFLIAEGIPTNLVVATVGKVLPPEKVRRATEETAVQKQAVKTQNERVLAENSRAMAEKAAAEADKAYMRAMGLSADQYIKMKELENQRVAIDKGASVSIIMGNAQPMYNVK